MPEARPLPEAVLRLDGRAVPCPPGLTLAALLEARCIAAAAVATAVNGAFVARDERAARVLAPGDTVLTFRAIVGG